MKINIIVATEQNNGIGQNNTLPWDFRKDMKYFSNITKGNYNNAVIMGRNTYESIGNPLPKRYNIILSKSIKITTENTSVFHNIGDAITFCKNKHFEDVWIIGGETIYKQFLDLHLHLIDNIYITKIMKDYECDTFFPCISDHFKMISSSSITENDTVLKFLIYSKS
tara:strand:- start:1666 stop:2166 length:501 start_codon:yes stop_codon:yes gene_type:complete